MGKIVNDLKLELTDYQTLKKEKFKGCDLNSLIFISLFKIKK